MGKVIRFPIRRRATGSWDADMRKPGESLAEQRTREHKQRMANPCAPPTCCDEITWEFVYSQTDISPEES